VGQTQQHLKSVKSNNSCVQTQHLKPVNKTIGVGKRQQHLKPVKKSNWCGTNKTTS
jgi:hypothetical protein